MRRFFALLSLILSAGAAQAQPNLLANGEFAQDTTGWTLTGGDAIKSTTLSVVGQPFRKALQLTLDPNPGAPGYSLLLRQPVGAAFRQGEPLTLRVWLRSPGGNKVAAFHEEMREPFAKSLGGEVTLTPEWKEYEFPGATKSALAAGESAVTFHLGYARGSVEIASVRLMRGVTAPSRTGTTGGAGGAAGAAAPTTVTPGETVAEPLLNGDFAAGNQGWKMAGLDRAKANLVRAQAGPYRQAVRLEVTPKPEDKPWTVSLNQPLAVALKKDEPLLMALWMRSPEKARAGLFVEQVAPPHEKLLTAEVPLGPEWKQFYFAGKATKDYAPGAARLNFHLAYGPGTIEIAGIRMASGQAAALPLDPGSLLINGDFSRGTVGWMLPTEVNWTILDAQAGDFRQTLHFDMSANLQAWTKNMKQPLTMALKQGTPLTMKLWMRSPQGNRVTPLVEEVKAPHAKTLIKEFTLTPQWKEYEIKGAAPKDYAPGELTVTIYLSRDTGSIEITGVRLLVEK